MNENQSAQPDKEERRLQGVLALLAGQPVATVCHLYNLSRSNLYKFKRRALEALREAMADRPRGPRQPSRRLTAEQEQEIKAVCERHPTFSSYQVHRSLGYSNSAPTPRTIQRVRQRLHLPRLPKRAAPRALARHFSSDQQQLIMKTIKAKLYLGPYRLAWDLRNQHGLSVSPSTVKRRKRAIKEEMNPRPAPVVWRRYERKHPHSLWHGDLMEKVTLTYEQRTAYQLTLLDDYSRAYVFCDLFREVSAVTTIQALIAAMRAFQTIPTALVFDNGPYFKGKLLQCFCRRLGIRLIHSAVYHPQTNGKLERAFRDDMQEFYRQREKWVYQELRRELPEYVEYRNNVRGHYALQGRPASTRLQEQNFYALPRVLEGLESYAWCERGQRVVGQRGLVRWHGRLAYIHPRLSGQKVRCYETLEGLEAEDAESNCYLLRHYRPDFCRRLRSAKDQTRPYYFVGIRRSRRAKFATVTSVESPIAADQNSPRNAVAL